MNSNLLMIPLPDLHCKSVRQSVQLLSRVWLFATPWTAARQASLSIANSRSLPKLISIEPVIPSNSLILSCPPTFNLSQHQGLFQWLSSSHQVAKVLEFPLKRSVLPMNIQGRSPLRLTGLISLLSKGLSGVFSSTTVRRYQFLGAQLPLWSNSHIHVWLQEKP